MQQRRDGVTRDRRQRRRTAISSALAALLARPRWRMALVWFMRTMACVWIAKGVFNWTSFSALDGRFGDFARCRRPCR